MAIMDQGPFVANVAWPTPYAISIVSTYTNVRMCCWLLFDMFCAFATARVHGYSSTRTDSRRASQRYLENRRNPMNTHVTVCGSLDGCGRRWACTDARSTVSLESNRARSDVGRAQVTIAKYTHWVINLVNVLLLSVHDPEHLANCAFHGCAPPEIE